MTLVLVHFFLMDLNVANQGTLKQQHQGWKLTHGVNLDEETQVPWLVQVEEVFLWHLLQQQNRLTQLQTKLISFMTWHQSVFVNCIRFKWHNPTFSKPFFMVLTTRALSNASLNIAEKFFLEMCRWFVVPREASLTMSVKQEKISF